MNMIMDNTHLHHQQQAVPPTVAAPHRSADLRISTTPPVTSLPSSAITSNITPANHSNNHSHNQNQNNNNNSLHNNNNNINNNNNDSPISPITALPTTKVTMKRSFDVAFLMMPDERIKQKQAEKQARLCDIMDRQQQQHQQQQQQQQHNQQFVRNLSPRPTHPTHLTHHLHHHHHHHQQQQHQQQQQQHQQLNNSSIHLEPSEQLFNMQEVRRYPQITIRSPRIYDDPTVLLPAAEAESLPLRSAFTKVSSARLESPVQQPAPPLSPDQLSCPSMSPPVATTPPRTNSGNGSLSNGSSSTGGGSGGGGGGSTTPSNTCIHPNIIYQSFRPEYQFNGVSFQSVNQVQALQAHRIKQQLLYRPPPMNSSPNMIGGGNVVLNGGNSNTPPLAPPDFLPGYSGFPFPPSAAAGHPFVGVAPPELPRIVQNPAAAAILSTLIPPTLASTFTLTAQNVCAKCNISFRMTSDLVYHMRSHHKSEVACDPSRRKREEKLKCPVCQESFRERHHLTRHMTAHQDKESDQAGGTNASATNLHNANLNGLSIDNADVINVGGGGGVSGSNGGNPTGGGGNNRHYHHASRVAGITK